MDKIELWAIIQSSETQKAILLLLKKVEALYQSEIARRVGKSQPTTLYHLRTLKKHNLLQSRAVGKYKIYYLSETGKEFANRLVESSKWDS